MFVADSAQTMNRLWQRERYDLLILDLMMPGEDGLSIMRRLRGGNDTTPIIMLTAKGEDVDRIVGLEMGADDYLAKPFNPRELLARINAVLRRRVPDEHPERRRATASPSTFGDFVLDLATRTLTESGVHGQLDHRRVCGAQDLARIPMSRCRAKTDGNRTRARI